MTSLIVLTVVLILTVIITTYVHYIRTRSSLFYYLLTGFSIIVIICFIFIKRTIILREPVNPVYLLRQALYPLFLLMPPNSMFIME